MARIHPIEHPVARLMQINPELIFKYGFRREDEENVRAVSKSLINFGLVPYYWGNAARDREFSPEKEPSYECIDILGILDERGGIRSNEGRTRINARVYMLPPKEKAPFGERFRIVMHQEQYTDFETEHGVTLIPLIKGNCAPIDLALLTQKRFDEQVRVHKLGFSLFTPVAIVR